MANLTYVEKLRLEKLLDMGGGYVLNFSDKTFQRFVFESIGIDMYAPNMDARGTSKAKRLRYFWETSPGHTVGKLLAAICEYYRFTYKDADEELVSECERISRRLLSEQPAVHSGASTFAAPVPAQPYPAPASNPAHSDIASQSTALLAEFDRMWRQEDPNRRGYLLEDFLCRCFQLHGINVTHPFKRNGGAEQIDGAFKLDGWHYLVECRWREKLADIRQVDGLRGQVSRSGRQTMGIYFSITGWSENVPLMLKQSPDKSVLLMNGYDLWVVLEGRIGLRELLNAKLAAFNVEGEPFVGAKEIIERLR